MDWAGPGAEGHWRLEQRIFYKLQGRSITEVAVDHVHTISSGLTPV